MPERHDMVNWYSPPQLIQTAIRVGISTVFGEYADRRDAIASAAEKPPPACAPELDYAAAGGELWLDYVADTGDGWNPTHAVARLANAPRLSLHGLAEPLPRGRVMVLGGDQVYPTASREDYRTRLLGPWDAAAAGAGLEEDRPDVYALPGNHDWYDGLSSFLGLFCSGRQRVACGRTTRQTRSYFALRLPGKVWLWGVDLQLSGYMDKGQVAYFTHVATKWMDPGSRVILCTGDPAWIYAGTEDHKPDQAKGHFKNFAFVEWLAEKAGHEICLVLTGDSHHYARYDEALDGGGTRHYVTCGGGGAFLHPTHHLPAAIEVDGWSPGRPARRFALGHDPASGAESLYPPRAASRAMTWGNLAFAWKNKVFTGCVMLAIAAFTWLLAGNAALLEAPSLSAALAGGLQGGVLGGLWGFLLVALATPWPAAAMLAGFAAQYYFAEYPAGWHAAGVAAGHGAAHLLAIALCAILLSGLTADLPAADLWLVLANGAVAGLLSATIFGLYLLLSLQGFGRHWNEAFSSLRIEGWKCFLRLRIAADGTVTVFPVGLRRVPRTPTGDAAPAPLAPELIEREIVIPPRRG